MMIFQKALKCYQPKNNQEVNYKMKMHDLLQNKGELAFTRESLDAHFTASAWLIDKESKKVLLLHHSKLNKWLQPGGHADGEVDLEKVARKEAFEETNLAEITLLVPGIFDIDIHLIPEYRNIKAHFHYDVRYAFLVKNADLTQINNESKAYKWLQLNEIKKLTDNTSILRMVRKTEEIFKE